MQTWPAPLIIQRAIIFSWSTYPLGAYQDTFSVPETSGLEVVILINSLLYNRFVSHRFSYSFALPFATLFMHIKIGDEKIWKERYIAYRPCVGHISPVAYRAANAVDRRGWNIRGEVFPEIISGECSYLISVSDYAPCILSHRFSRNWISLSHSVVLPQLFGEGRERYVSSPRSSAC